jgi:3-oxoacyl-[acyl-carrier protein] reductase
VRDRVALVTGGSRGIGRAIVVRLAEQGWSIGVNYRADAAAAKTAVDAVHATGGEAVALQCDVADPRAVEAMFGVVEEALGPVAALVNNAGIRRDGLTARMSEARWGDVIATNLTAAFLCARRALRSMVPKKWGRIVNVSSVAGLLGSEGQANYAAAKAGMLGLTRSLARETARAGITVNAVTPGLVATDLTSDLSDQQRRRLLERIPARRPGTPEDVAALVGFLCGDEAGYVNGAVIAVDGGLAA